MRPLRLLVGFSVLFSKAQGAGGELSPILAGVGESATANARDAAARRPPSSASASTAAAAAARPASTVRTTGSQTSGLRGEIQQQQQQQQRGQQEAVQPEVGRLQHRGQQRRQRGRKSSPDAAAATPAAAAAAAGGNEAQTPEEQRLLAEVVVSEEGEEGDEEGDTPPLVPSFCPSGPFERYAALHRGIVDGLLERRYLVFRPYLYCGMGNRLKGFRGVLALSMLTDRALLVDWYGGLGASRDATAHKYEDNFLEPNGVPWATFPPALGTDYDSPKGDNSTTSSVEVWCQLPNAVGLITPCDESRMTPDFLETADWDDIFARDTQVVIVQAHNSNPMDYLRLNDNPNVARALWKLDWDVHSEVFDTCSLRFLLKPRPDFRNRYCQERSTVLDGLIPSIALHVRTGDNPDYHPEWYETLPQDLDNFLECAAGFQEGLAIVATEYPTPGPDFDVFNVFKEEAGSVWLFGTDSSMAIDLLTEGNNTVGQGGRVAFVEGDEFYRAHSGSKGGSASNNAGPLIDLALLSEAPLLVGSYCSTFSENAAEIGGLPSALRLFLSTPFRRVIGRNMVDWDRFDDYRQGCRDVVSDPASREDLRRALSTRLEPWIGCEDDAR